MPTPHRSSDPSVSSAATPGNRGVTAWLERLPVRLRPSPVVPPTPPTPTAPVPCEPWRVAHGWLGGVRRQPSPNHGSPFAAPPEAIVVHYTAGASLASAVHTLTQLHGNASAHLVIDRDGTVVQLVPFAVQAWHAGVSSWRGRTQLNRWSLGIELVNAGYLEARGERLYTWWGQAVAHPDAVAVLHPEGRPTPTAGAWWQVFPAEQIQQVQRVCACLREAYPSIAWVLGHDEVSPRRKWDPGPAYPLNALRQSLGLAPIGDRP